MNRRILLFSLLALTLTSCSEQEVEVDRSSGFDVFVEQYNEYILDWLNKELAGVEEREKKLETDLAAAETELEKSALEKDAEALQSERKKYEYRLNLKEYISFKTEADIPADLVWENGLENPIIGDPRAKKGGVFHAYIVEFPPTVRPVGPNSNSSFRGKLYDEIDMSLIDMHPITGKFVPALAREWAIGPDKQTVFFRLDPEATYSDGVKIQAIDYVFDLYVRLSNNIKAPYPKQYFREQIANITVYTEDLISVSLPQPKPLLPYYTSLGPMPPHFYKEYGPDYAERYQWRVPPTTGAYTILPGDLKKGRSITLSRVKNWWAKDKKYTQHAFNADKIVYQLIADKSKAFELFRIGQLDNFYLGEPEYWYEKMEIDEYFDGYIEKAQWYNVYPRVPRGMYFNVTVKPFDNLDVRKGIAHSLNFQKVNTILFRGDADRLKHFSEGFREYSSTSIEPREFSITKAQAHFAKAGYTETDSEGYLTTKDGKRLKVKLSWGQYPINDKMMALLKEDARKTGLEITMDVQQGTVFFKRILEKRHQMCYTGWGVTPPFPRYYSLFHSYNAFDKKGNPKPQTNNINTYSNPKMDRLAELVRNATSTDEIREASHAAQQIIHDEAIFIPALKTAYVRMAYWNWVKWPQTPHYEHSAPDEYVPTEGYLYWIDQEVKKQTLVDRKQGKVYPEKKHLYDLYRNGIPSLEELDNRKPETP